MTHMEYMRAVLGKEESLDRRLKEHVLEEWVGITKGLKGEEQRVVEIDLCRDPTVSCVQYVQGSWSWSSVCEQTCEEGKECRAWNHSSHCRSELIIVDACTVHIFSGLSLDITKHILEDTNVAILRP
jgi:hypothetical protein